MNYQNAATQALSSVGGSRIGGPDAPRQRTLAERLESANGILGNQISRVESFIERVNGTPRAPQGESPAKIAATAPLASSVEMTEMLGKRLAELADQLDRIG